MHSDLFLPEVYFQRSEVESNVATFLRPTSRKFLQKFYKYRKTTCIQIYSSQSLHKACHAISPSPRQPWSLETCNTNASKLKKSKLKTRKTDDHNNLKAWVASQVALCLLLLARPSSIRLTGAQPQTTSGQQKFRDPKHCLCWLQTCGGLMLLELTAKINLHSLPIHLESTSLRVH